MIITIEITALDRFRASWPCNGLEDAERTGEEVSR